MNFWADHGKANVAQCHATHHFALQVLACTTRLGSHAYQSSVLPQELTKSRLHPLGGQAYLSLEDGEQPFAGGIKFTAMPPTKRYREMDQLSGGEKTVAALALLFAIHRCRRTPPLCESCLRRHIHVNTSSSRCSSRGMVCPCTTRQPDSRV